MIFAAWVRRLSRPGGAIARGLGAAGRLAARVTYSARRGRVWELVAEQAARRGGRVSAADVCAAVVPGVQVTGAWLSAAPDAQAGHLMQVTDEVSGQLAELQLTLGEGPLLDASAFGGLMLDAQDTAAGGTGPRAGPGGQPADLALHRAEIDQATGMLTEQLGVNITDAFVRLRAYAYVNDRQLTDVARDIVARRLRLFPDPDLFPSGET
jgi:hypothetical protein